VGKRKPELVGHLNALSPSARLLTLEAQKTNKSAG